MSILRTAILGGVGFALWQAIPRSTAVPFAETFGTLMMAIPPLVLWVAALFVVRGYKIAPTGLRVQCLLWATTIDLRGLSRAWADPNATKVQKFGTIFAPGDKVIQRVNNYDKEVFNGDIGRITRIDLEESAVIVDFDSREASYDFSELDEISLAYTASIHKSQGSEYPAVTRGKKLVVVIAEPKNRKHSRWRCETGRRRNGLPAW